MVFVHIFTDTHWLVVWTPVKNMSSSVGITIFPIYGQIKFMFQTTNQLCNRQIIKLNAPWFPAMDSDGDRASHVPDRSERSGRGRSLPWYSGASSWTIMNCSFVYVYIYIYTIYIWLNIHHIHIQIYIYISLSHSWFQTTNHITIH